ncbi:sulfatase-like hydrolase/transferase [Candidatus Epulonipiscium viviparus]|uniref:sulfatase-like hydrolase/transferase n=1 Tax=Candidatus Epulonipiscium viviparus TaxID=420336 RepID=UPI0027380A1B|nr:sulfatase-like hydrolase/transferase [Candidatus Epulopiscium viviparus]
MKQPNILYIMSDDHASNSISCYNSMLSSVFKTPNLDRIAYEGCRMDNYYATNSICVPARATVMTGQYGNKNGVKTLADKWNPNQPLNLAKIMTDAGYQTAMFGKWHLDCDPIGFEEYQYLDMINGKHPRQQGIYWDPEFRTSEGEFKKYEGYVTEIITDMTKDYILNRDKNKPFFIMCNHKAPHDYWQFAAKYKDIFDGVDIPIPESLFEDRSHRNIASREYGSSVTPRHKVRSLYNEFCKPNYVTGPLEGTEDMTFEEKGIAAYQKYLKDYLRTVASIDESVGYLYTVLKHENILDDTVIIYTSDQGMFLGEHDYQDKRWSYEESLGTPLMIRYRDEIKPNTVSKELMANIDIAPTILDYAGIEVPAEMQGVSARDIIKGEHEAIHEGVYFRYWMHLAHRHDNPAHYGVVTKDYKLIFYYGMPLDATGAVQTITPGGFELYDLKNDPMELNNVYDDPNYEQMREVAKRLLESLKKEYGDTDTEYSDLQKLYSELK